MKDIEDESDQYSLPFTKGEFEAALKTCNIDSAPGLNKLSYEAIKKLPQEGLEYLRTLFNACFARSA